MGGPRGGNCMDLIEGLHTRVMCWLHGTYGMCFHGDYAP